MHRRDNSSKIIEVDPKKRGIRILNKNDKKLINKDSDIESLEEVKKAKRKISEDESSIERQNIHAGLSDLLS
jgi:hypothetical protein